MRTLFYICFCALILVGLVTPESASLAKPRPAPHPRAHAQQVPAKSAEPDGAGEEDPSYETRPQPESQMLTTAVGVLNQVGYEHKPWAEPRMAKLREVTPAEIDEMAKLRNRAVETPYLYLLLNAAVLEGLTQLQNQAHKAKEKQATSELRNKYFGVEHTKQFDHIFNDPIAAAQKQSKAIFEDQIRCLRANSNTCDRALFVGRLRVPFCREHEAYQLDEFPQCRYQLLSFEAFQRYAGFGGGCSPPYSLSTLSSFPREIFGEEEEGSEEDHKILSSFDRLPKEKCLKGLKAISENLDVDSDEQWSIISGCGHIDEEYFRRRFSLRYLQQRQTKPVLRPREHRFRQSCGQCPGHHR
jgi:hypothetical protein